MNRVCNNEACDEANIVKSSPDDFDDLKVLCGSCQEPTELTDAEVNNASPAN